MIYKSFAKVIGGKVTFGLWMRNWTATVWSPGNNSVAIYIGHAERQVHAFVSEILLSRCTKTAECSGRIGIARVQVWGSCLLAKHVRKRWLGGHAENCRLAPRWGRTFAIAKGLLSLHQYS